MRLKLRPTPVVTLLALALFLLAGPLQLWKSAGLQLSNRRLEISNSIASGTSNYLLSFGIRTANTLGSIRVQFCSDTPLVGTSCAVPNGFDLSGATLINQTGITDFSISPLSTANELILTRTASFATPQTLTYELSGVTNPSANGSYFVRVETFATEDATGPNTDSGGLSFAINSPVNVNATVPPYLLFCVANNIPLFDCAQSTGNFVDFGELSTAQARIGETQILAASNAQFGYNISVHGTTLTSGNNAITALTSDDVSKPGTGQFGMNLQANSTPNGGQDPFGAGVGAPAPGYDQPNFFRFNSGDVVAATTEPDDYRQYTATYMVNVSKSQPAGVYVSTLTYIALANF